MQQAFVAGRPRRAHRGQNTAAAAGDRRIVDAQQALLPLLRTIPAVDEVGVRVDQARRDQPAAQVDCPIRGGSAFTRAGVHDRLALDGDSAVVDEAVRLITAQRREAGVGQ